MLESLITPVSRETADTIIRVPLDKIRDNPFQTRIHDDPVHVGELARSIQSLKAELPATLGLQQPPLARLAIDIGSGLEEVSADLLAESGVERLLRHPDVLVQLAFGHSRYRAFLLLARGPLELGFLIADVPGLELDPDYAVMPLIIGRADDQAMWRHAVIENAQRRDISAVEEARSIKRAMDEFGLSTEEAAAPFGWQRSTAANKLRLLQLPDGVQNAIVRGEISEKHGRELLRLAPAPALLMKAYDDLVQDDLSTRDLEHTVDCIAGEQPVPAWDLAWDPTDHRCHGACDVCPHYVNLGRRNVCLDQDCHRVKVDLWPAENERRQRLAARLAMDAAGMEAVPLLEQSAPRPYDTSVGHIFGSYWKADPAFVKSGRCGPHCTCFAAIYVEKEDPWSHRQLLRPDAEAAPNVVFCCTDSKALEAQEEAADEADEELQAAKAAREAERARDESIRQQNMSDAWEHLSRAVDAIGGPLNLWTNEAFVVDLIMFMRRRMFQEDELRTELAQLPIEQLHDAVLQEIIRWHDRWDSDQGLHLVKVPAVQALANRIAPPPQPEQAPSAPDWRTHWGHIDQHHYDELMAMGTWTVDDIMTSHVCLRLIAEEDEDMRPALWRRHNEIERRAPRPA